MGKDRERKQKQKDEHIQSGSEMDWKPQSKTKLEKSAKGRRNKRRADTEWEPDGWEAIEHTRQSGKSQRKEAETNKQADTEWEGDG
jgi:hypothetical protein